MNREVLFFIFFSHSLNLCNLNTKHIETNGKKFKSWKFKAPFSQVVIVCFLRVMFEFIIICAIHGVHEHYLVQIFDKILEIPPPQF